MDNSKTMHFTNQESTGLLTKIIALILAIAPPVIAANMTLWAASELSGKIVSKRARRALIVGSFAIAFAIHYLFVLLDLEKWAWIATWACAIGTEPLLKFLYLEFGGMLKQWCKNQLQQALNLLDKKRK